jgi:hypothetical protein
MMMHKYFFLKSNCEYHALIRTISQSIEYNKLKTKIHGNKATKINMTCS